ncbi:lipoprotein [Actinokineospora sp. HUAS TT18]|uniref:lipoprotein n=1 Tax=Actinokineospora sp. HUAS TT18 TaxID=3447451 RepID=UPI003F521DF0
MLRLVGVGVVLFVAVAGCAGETGGQSSSPPTTAVAVDVWADHAEPAASGGPVSCAMPIGFDMAAGASATVPDTGERDGLNLACEVKGAGQMQVWTGSAMEPRAALDKFLAGEGPVTDPRYRDTKVGKGNGVEVTYVNTKGVRGRAFAMATTLRSAVVAAAGADFDQVAPEYLLAKDTLTPIER